MYNPLLTKCKECGATHKGKYYRLMLFATPFVLLFYAILAVAVSFYPSLVPGYDTATYILAGAIAFLIFFVPGVLLLYFLREPRYICPECQRKKDLEAWRREIGGDTQSLLNQGMSETEIIRQKLLNNPQAREIVIRFSERSKTRPSLVFVDSVIEATNQERAGNIDVAVAMYEQISLYDEAGRVRIKKNINRNVTVDLNELIEQLRYGGLALNYKCPSCGASITYDKDSDISSMRFCGYCGSMVNPEILTSLLRETLGR
ncbi:MAG: hypothetical protein LUO79_00020 [Methanomassiliicoccales archaeon]|nr:hypothetical protein [Methanomassiliicoccales archaeon]